MKNKKVLLVGCGDIGVFLGSLLTEMGFEVIGLRRSKVSDAPFKMLVADLLRPETLAILDSEYDFVVYTATPSEISPDGYESIYVQGLKHLMAAIEPPKERLFLVSSTGVYHQSHGEWVDENSETLPTRFSGKTLLRSEQLALETWPNTTVVRFAGIYGPGRLRLIKKVQQSCTVLECPPVYTNRIHRDDCAGILAFLMAKQLKGVPLETIYIGVDHDPATNADVLDFVAKQLGAPIPERESADDVEAVKQNKRCRNQRILSLGYEFKYPSYKEGYKEIIESMD